MEEVSRCGVSTPSRPVRVSRYDSEGPKLSWGSKEEKEKAEETLSALETAFSSIIHNVGDPEPDRDALTKTPHRAAKAFLYFTKGYEEDLQSVVQEGVFDESHDEMVVVKDIELFSLCEHHLVPFCGRVCVGYLPTGKILGLSKVARHMCMTMRGVSKSSSKTMTSSMIGVFRTDSRTREEFLDHIKSSR